MCVCVLVRYLPLPLVTGCEAKEEKVGAQPCHWGALIALKQQTQTHIDGVDTSAYVLLTGMHSHSRKHTQDTCERICAQKIGLNSHIRKEEKWC